jgi:hypothetical protein
MSLRTLQGHLGRRPRAARLAKWIPASHCACLVWRQLRAEPTPVGFLMCSKVHWCDWTAAQAAAAAARALGDAMVASHGLRFVLPHMLASLLSKATDGWGSLARHPRNVRTWLKSAYFQVQPSCNVISASLSSWRWSHITTDSRSISVAVWCSFPDTHWDCK